MNTFLLVKTLHILSSVLMVGTGFGTAFYLFWANRSGSVAAQAVVSKWVIKADWWFTTPAVVFQPLSGLWLAHYLGVPWSATWIWLTLLLYAVAGMCWLPVVYLQLKMAKLADEAWQTGANAVTPVYYRYARWWEYLGYPAFCAMVVVYFLMVMKPS
ncbi:DUF2269 family protein [Conchiformibius steedae]|uniref:DUF2269 domain-containing protein n=1 Tax=Conchiformibius steedae TaxID=153493 RepID=A0A3P2A7Z8_9NEIS|nr:DUF2269 domain-containing protein [Conchiformibius steedae]RRD89743.1 DUF2269 domain-containing protein [Conchiformibius steedae]